MNTTKWNILAIVGWMTSACALLGAVESTSEKFVVTAITIHGNSGSGDSVTPLAVPTVRPVSAAGTVTALGSNTVVDANANWQAGQFGGSYIEFDSGLMADILGLNATTKTLTLAGDVRSSVTTGARYRIRKHNTIADVFGASNRAGLMGDENEARADNIILQYPQATRTVFNYAPLNLWLQSDYSPASNVVIYPEQGVFVRRKTSADALLVTSGVAKEGSAQVPIQPGFNLVGTLKATRSVRLADLNLFTGNPLTGVAAAENYNDADNLWVINTDSTTSLYFYYPGFGWIDFAYNAANDVLIPPGSAFLVQRKASRGLFFWNILPE